MRNFRGSSLWLSGDDSNIDIYEYEIAPLNFDNPIEAARFFLGLDSVAEFAEYDPSLIDEDTMDEFAADLLVQLQLLKFKYIN